MADKIQDFGEKIGGARKDLASLSRSLTIGDAEDWTKAERETFINKKYLWAVPDYKEMVDNGMPIEVAYFKKAIRDSIPVKPANSTKEYQDGYINFVGSIKDAVEAIETKDDAERFFDETVNGRFAQRVYGNSYRGTDEAYGCLTTKFLRASTYSERNIQRDIEKKQFLYSDEDKLLSAYKFSRYNGSNVRIESDRIAVSSGLWNTNYFYNNPPEFMDINNWKKDTVFVTKGYSIAAINFDSLEEAKRCILEAEKAKGASPSKTSKQRKTRLLPKQLEHIERIGDDCLLGRNISGDDMLSEFCFRGGEFGNWENQNDRQTNLNMSYEAFCDLADALDMEREDVSLGGSLSIAYGARGHSSALAHFEPERDVINLTKMKGAGSLAHEWGHALDFYIAKEADLNERFATESRSPALSKMKAVVNAMRYTKENGRETFSDYYMDSVSADKKYSKEDKGYWASDTEMFARAFACYVKDRLEEKSVRSDFLCGHADSTVYPKGEERKAINKAIDCLIADMKEKNLLRGTEQETKRHAKQIERD